MAARKRDVLMAVFPLQRFCRYQASNQQDRQTQRDDAHVRVIGPPLRPPGRSAVLASACSAILLRPRLEDVNGMTDRWIAPDDRVLLTRR